MRIAVENTLKLSGKRAVGNDGHSVRLAVRQKPGLNCPVHQIIAELVRNDPVFLHALLGLLKQGHGKIADANEPHFPGFYQLFHGRERFCHRNQIIRAMELIEIDAIDAQSPQTLIGRFQHIGISEMGRRNFRGDEDPVPYPLHGLPDHIL